MREKWIYHAPVFEGDKYNEILLKFAPWSGLRNFAYDLVSFLEPKSIVELGSHYGCSAFTFLQAIKDQSLETQFYAIDTWEGDSYTKYSDVEDVYGLYSKIEQAVFSGQNTNKLRCRFDEALAYFPDSSIDILHIDGSHKYEDVKSDYETWFSKVRDDGLILLHDVGEDLVDGEKMGSHYFWKDISKSGAYCLEIPFSCGLGIVAKEENILKILADSFSIEHYWKQNDLRDTINKEAVRSYYFRIKDQESFIRDLLSRVDTLTDHIHKYEKTTAEKDKYISELEVSQKNQTETKELKKQIKQYKKTIKSKEEYIKELLGNIESLSSFADAKEEYVREVEENIRIINKFADDKDRYAQELQYQIKELLKDLSSKEKYTEELNKNIEALNSFTESKEIYIGELRDSISELNKLVDSKENYIEELKNTISLYEENAIKKEAYIIELETDREKLNTFAASKDEYIEELKERLEELERSASKKNKSILKFLDK